MHVLGALWAGIERFQNRPFLEAAMAVCALTAAAGGTVTFAQRYQIDAIVATLDRLRIYDPHEAVDILEDDLRRLRSNRTRAVDSLVAKIRRYAGDEEASRLLVRIASLMVTADGPVAGRAGAMFDQVCAVLGLGPAEDLPDRSEGGA